MRQLHKMHGLGNDFVILDGRVEPVAMTAALAKALADRQTGIGCDQLILLGPSDVAALKMNIFNADGGEVQHCGNGARCFVHFVRDQGLTDKKTIRVDTLSGVLELRLQNDGQVSVDMGEPIFDPPKIPFDPTWLATESVGDDRVYTLLLNGRSWRLSVISVGNPHAVIRWLTSMPLPCSWTEPCLSAIRHFHRGSMWALCRCLRSMRLSYECLSAALAKHLPAALAPAQQR